ncbi:hypothetical protein HZY83_03790 [Gemella sp. GH3]|uniref:hypothetical protein n=1 Tax=unclassified Gemella TaxID=2624949 RepID=UPI0015CFC12B|nr:MULTISPECIES: hypothetical protein [unclassified Gemella]MBF0713803.1 hypothetical protein [Gemella sp. GH3.1]NYS50755.1 hypothetical protein [Gemella sp. GH3]
MLYTLQIIFPREEAIEDDKQVTTNKKELLIDKEGYELIDLHKKYQSMGYLVNVTFRPTYEETDPFTIANNLTQLGIDYKATLKIKNTNDYEKTLKLANIIENQGYDYEISVKLKINETSPVDFTKEATWFGEGAAYSVKPKIAVEDISEIKMLYNKLIDLGYDTTINIRPKKQADMEFATQLSAYPEKTEVIFSLRDSKYFEE